MENKRVPNADDRRPVEQIETATLSRHVFLFRIKLIDNHVNIHISKCVQGSARFLLDTGSDLNMVKLSYLQDDVLFEEKQFHHLIGINKILLHTMVHSSLTYI